MTLFLVYVTISIFVGLYLRKKLKEAIKKVKKRYAALEDKLDKVSTNIAEMKTASSHDSLVCLLLLLDYCLN